MEFGVDFAPPIALPSRARADALAMADDLETDLIDDARAKGGLSVTAVRLIAERIPPEKIAAKIEQMLEAKLVNNQPDWRAVEIGLKLYLSYTVGLPVQRQEIVQHKITSPATLTAMLTDPEAIEALQRQIDAARAATAKPVKAAA